MQTDATPIPVALTERVAVRLKYQQFFERARKMKTTTFVLVWMLLATPCIADTIIVDSNGSGDYTSIQDAIDNSSNGDTIEVRPGAYYENINFYGKAITVSGTDPNDMGVVYSTVIDGGTAASTVTFDSGEDADSLLIGLTVEDGGTGIDCYYSDPTIRKCVVRYADDTGGAGIYGDNAQPAIEDCEVRENAGDGIYNCDGQIKNCKIRENADCGLLYCGNLILGCEIAENSNHGLSDCDGEIKQCTITGNAGGLWGCNGQIRECVISRNSGYGIYVSGGQAVEVLNCIVSGNGASGLHFETDNSVTNRLTNCTVVGNKGDGVRANNRNGAFDTILSSNIVVSNGAYGINRQSTTVTVTLKYNNIWGNTSGNYTGLPPGENDTHEDPLFAIDGYWNIDDEWVEGDYHLKSVAGRWTDSGWVNDDVNSLCIDAGDPTGSYAKEPEPNGDRINQGVYGGTEYASKSPYGPEPYCADYPAGDVNWDCKVDFIDVAAMAGSWLECNLVPPEACWE